MRKALPWVLLAALAGFVAWKLHTSHFDWAGFGRSLRTADWRMLLAALLVIYVNYVLRAVRWAVFLRRTPSTARWWQLVGSQFVGFTGLSLFGRIGELIRPLLVARRTGLSFASQIAVVAVERVFDLGAFGLLFGLNLAVSPGLDSLPFHERFHQVGYVIAGLTLIVAAFVVSVRVAGGVMARLMSGFVGIVSKNAGASVAEKVHAFREGLDVIAGWGDFASVAGISIVLWATIAVSYVLVMKAFPAPVSHLTVAHTLLLMGFSVVGSLVQLPGVGGGAQAMTIAALTLLFGIPQELAVSSGLMLWLITTMGVIPVGLVYAKVEGISLEALARRSEEAEEAVIG
ncbi:flippase-like domain-containing protein [Granulicella sp. WH15]|nr:flippase-like domain-containing protein [Granulicella sp. WH15]